MYNLCEHMRSPQFFFFFLHFFVGSVLLTLWYLMDLFFTIAKFWVRAKVFNATFKIISYIAEAISMGDNRSTRRNPSTWPHSLTNYHIMVHQVYLVKAGFELTTLMVICIDSIGSCKSNYYAITTTTTPIFLPLLEYRSYLQTHWLFIYQYW